MKLFLLFCFAVFFFTGCNHGDDKGQVSGPKDPTKAQMRKTKPVSAPVAQEISTGLSMLKELGDIYGNIALKASQHKVDRSNPEKHQLLEDNEVDNPKNVFRLVRELLSLSFSEDGQPKALAAKAKGCEGGFGDIETKESGEGSQKSYVHELVFLPCQQNGKSVPLARLEKQKDGSWMLRFYLDSFVAEEGSPVNLLKAEPPYGRLTLELIEKLKKESKDGSSSGCQIWWDSNKKYIAGFNCYSLTADIKGTKEAKEAKATRAIFLDKIHYRRNEKIEATASGTFVDFTVDPVANLELKVEVPKVDAVTVTMIEKKLPPLGSVKNSDSSAPEKSAEATASQPAANGNAPLNGNQDPQPSVAQEQTGTPAVGSQEGAAQENGQSPKPQTKMPQVPPAREGIQVRDPHLLQQAVDSGSPSQVGIEQGQPTAVY